MTQLATYFSLTVVGALNVVYLLTLLSLSTSTANW